MTLIFFTLAIICMIAVFGTLVFGIFAMTKDGEFNKKYGNRLMTARVYLQGLALALLALAYLSSKGQ